MTQPTFPIRAFRPTALTIRDPVHDYLTFTALERQVIDTRIFQRLRFITQNATAFFTYPSDRTARFEHSLGCCHLAGRFVEALVANTAPKVLQAFLRAWGAALEAELEPSSATELLWQGMRLAALLHDLGHLPFSHLCEKPVEANLGRLPGFRPEHTLARPYHEWATVELVAGDPELAAVFAEVPLLRKAVLGILTGKESTVPAFRALHDVVSAEVDVDRGDYIRRDGLACGVEHGRYDVHRILEAMRLVPGPQPGSFLVRPLESALPALEGFLAERVRLHQTVYFHPRVVMTDALLMAALDILVQLHTEGDVLAREHFELERFHPQSYLKDGLPADEVWLWSVLRTLYRALDPTRQQTGPASPHRTLWALLDALLLRRPRVFALWKRVADYRRFDARWVAPALTHSAIPVKAGQLYLNALARHLVGHDFRHLSRLGQRMVRPEEGFRVLVETKSLRALSQDYTVIRRGGGDDGRDQVALSELSAPLRSLDEAFESAIHLFVFVLDLRPEEPDADRRQELEERGGQVLVEELKRWLEEVGWSSLPLFKDGAGPL